MMLQQPVADDYLVATGKTHSVRHPVEIAFDRGAGLAAVCCTDPRFMRPAEVDLLLGDSAKARRCGLEAGSGF